MADTLDFSLSLSRGELFTLEAAESLPLEGVTAIVGPSGGGKTTLLRALAGLEPSDGGQVSFRGEVWDDDKEHLAPEARRIGFVFQNNALFPHLTVAGNLHYGARRREVTNYDAIIDALDLGDLLERWVTNLSGGEVRRVALARALASNPAVLFLDEPLVGLDAARKAELLPYIARAVAEARVPSIYVTHSLAEVTSLADRVLGISGGRLTGWQLPPARLTSTVIETTDDVMRVRVDGAPDAQGEMTLPLMAAVGDSIGLGLRGDSILISANHPGRSDAQLCLPAKVIEGEGGLSLNVVGQLLRLPSGGPYEIGAQLWLTVLKTMPRPELRDSAKNRL